MSRLSFAVACGVAVCGLVSAGTNDKGKAYLEANQKKEGVITLPSGLQYKVLRKGSGANHPTKDSPCECHYEGLYSVQPVNLEHRADGGSFQGS